MGISREAALDLLPTAKVGDYILVHAGFGIEIVDEQSAAETLELIAEFPALAGLDSPRIAAENARADANAKSEELAV